MSQLGNHINGIDIESIENFELLCQVRWTKPRFLIVVGSDLQTPGQSPTCPSCPRKNAAERCPQSRGRPERDRKRK